MGNSVARRNDDPSSDSLRPGLASASYAFMAKAAPGWYYDPYDKAVYRFWDGACWTEHKSEVFLTTTP